MDEDVLGYDPPKGMEQFVNLWRSKFKLALEYRKEKFDKDAEFARKYYVGPHNFVYEGKGSIQGGEGSPVIEKPAFRMTFNKVFEFVTLFGPLLYHRNPDRTCTPRTVWRLPDELMAPPAPPPGPPMQQGMPGQPPPPAPPGAPPQQPPGPLTAQMQALPPNPMSMQQDNEDAKKRAVASLVEMILNYTPNELDLKAEMRLGIDEGLVFGRGTWWTEVYYAPGSKTKLIGSFFDSVMNFLYDPDVTRLKQAKWIARKCTCPVWELERKYGLPPGSIKGKMESTDSQAGIANGTLSKDKKQQQTADLVVYYEVWSKMGMGVRLKPTQAQNAVGDLAKATEVFGDYVYMVFCDECPYPLNVPQQYVDILSKITPDAVQAYKNPPPPQMQPDGTMGPPQLLPEIQMQVDVLHAVAPLVKWPIPFYADDEWPVTCFDPHPLFDCSWPLNHLKPAMGEQDFLDWAYSFLAGHIYNVCRDIIAVAKSAGEDIKETILKGGHMAIVELESTQKSISDLIQFLQRPQINKDLYEGIQIFEKNFEKRTGLLETMQGQTSTQSRSAQDAAGKQQMAQIRPDDMANTVEDVATTLARKEAIASRLLLTGQDVLPIVGQIGATFWDQAVRSDDVYAICREFDYRVEGGSARKPNKEKMVQDTQEGLNVIMPFVQNMAQQYGEWKPVLAILREWARARDWNIEPFLIDPAKMPPPPPPAPAPGQAGPPPQQAPPPPQPQAA